MDLTKQAPRSPYSVAILGVMGGARAADKARALLNGTIGEYRFGKDSGLDQRTFGFLGITPDAFLEAVKACPDDRALNARLKALTKRTIEEVKAYNESQRNRVPDSEEARQRFEQRKRNIDRMDLKMMSDMLDAEDVYTFGPPTDLTSGPPRSPHSGSLLGIVCLARMADKGRAQLAGKLGAYKFGDDSGLDRSTLEFVGMSAAEFYDGLKQHPDEGQLAKWLSSRIQKTDAEIAEWTKMRRARGPWNDESRQMFERRAQTAERPDVTTFVDLLDAEDAHDFLR